MNVLIIEDEGIAATRLKNMLAEVKPGAMILNILDSVEDSVSWLSENPEPDLILLDIELSDGLGFEIFKQTQISSPVIFTTAYNEYALRAFDLNCIDYLLKPISADKLAQALDKLEKFSYLFSHRLHERQITQLKNAFSGEKNYRTKFLIDRSDGYLPIFTDDVAFIYTENEKTYLTTANNEIYQIDFTIEKLQEELDPAIFWRANRAFIVSAQSIKKAHNYFNYKLKLELAPPSKKDVIVSRAKVQEFKTWFR